MDVLHDIVDPWSPDAEFQESMDWHFGPQPACDVSYRILVTGSRNWTDVLTIEKVLKEYAGAPNVTLVSGSCPTGADQICEGLATLYGWKIERYPADWQLYGGKAAGPVRNAAMVAKGADVCLAFIKDSSPGATGCAHLAKQAGIPTHVHNQNEDLSEPKVLNAYPHGAYNTRTQVFVGRPSKWGNPYLVGKDGTRDEVVDKYEAYLLASDLKNDLHELRDKNLVCFCAPKRCHADILLLLANTD